MPPEAGNLHGKESPARCTLGVCEVKHPAAPLAIRTVAMTVIGTLVTLSVCMSNHTVHWTIMCTYCFLVYQILTELVCSYLS